MSRFHVQAEFLRTPHGVITGDMIRKLGELLAIEGGDAFTRPNGWTASMFIYMAPGTEDAAVVAGNMMRKANKDAGLPSAVMTDMHIRRVGGFAPGNEEEHDGQSSQETP